VGGPESSPLSAGAYLPHRLSCTVSFANRKIFALIELLTCRNPASNVGRPHKVDRRKDPLAWRSTPLTVDQPATNASGSRHYSRSVWKRSQSSAYARDGKESTWPYSDIALLVSTLVQSQRQSHVSEAKKDAADPKGPTKVFGGSLRGHMG